MGSVMLTYRCGKTCMSDHVKSIIKLQISKRTLWSQMKVHEFAQKLSLKKSLCKCKEVLVTSVSTVTLNSGLQSVVLPNQSCSLSVGTLFG